MADFPVNVADKVKCEKCKYGYKSIITVFALKNVKYEAKCPQCSHVNAGQLSKGSIRAALGGGGEEDRGVGKEKGPGKAPGILHRSEIKGLYLAVAAVSAYIMGWIMGWVAESGTGERLAVFLQKLSFPVFALGITLLLFAIASKRNGN